MLHHIATEMREFVTDLSRFQGYQVPADPFIQTAERIARIIEVCANRDPAADTWIALPRVMMERGLSASYFRAKQKALSGKCRLEYWRDQHLAKQEGRQWFISTSIELPVGRRNLGNQHASPIGQEEDVVETQVQRMNFRLR
jgi:hypothetical protein